MKFQFCGKGTSAVVKPNYGYISVVSKILPNNELEVNSLKNGDVKKKYLKQDIEDDVSVIIISQIVQKLPEPELTLRFLYQYAKRF